MGMTLYDIVEMAMDNAYTCYVWDNEKEQQVFFGELVDIPNELLDQQFSSWEMNEGIIGFNIN